MGDTGLIWLAVYRRQIGEHCLIMSYCQLHRFGNNAFCNCRVMFGIWITLSLMPIYNVNIWLEFGSPGHNSDNLWSELC